MMDMNTPWTKMNSPKRGVLTTLRVCTDLFNSWYWIRCKDGQYGVAIHLPASESPATSTIKGTSKLNIVQVNDSNGKYYLGIVISSSELATVFHRLCLDLMSACKNISSQEEIVAILKRRVLSWQRLFQHGHKNLSPEECLGLITELKFLRECWLPKFSTNGIFGWLGPTGAPQDFKDEIIGLNVEVKSHRLNSEIIKISSREQLETDGLLFLVAYPAALASDDCGVSLNEFVEETRGMLIDSHVATFDELLLEARYIKDEYYDALHFVINEPKFFRVDCRFPRLTGDTLSPAIGKVKYEIDLGLVTDWTCSMTELTKRSES